MFRVYIAGAYSAPNVIDVLNNMRKGIRASTEVLLAGFAPFCPFIDYHYQLQLRDEENLSINDYYVYSMSWLEVSDVVYVIPGWENSKGTIREIARAKELNIGVVYNMKDLLLYKDSLRKQKDIDVDQEFMMQL